ncbi:multiprotein bridging factor aMBF1 [Candidatus Woesearchaeota archaeon]|nr:multiprotein bridging factor aMBF1 [Candidatus Woesearchaeota archaeon]
MPNCDMCGEETENLVVASIECVELTVCSKCTKFGKVVRRARPEIKEEKTKNIKKKELQREKFIQIVVPDYNIRIKNAREKLGLKQEDFAKNINEKVSLVHNIESGKFEPSMELARKIERFLQIQLVEQHEEKHEEVKGSSGEGFTIGDFIKVKK